MIEFCMMINFYILVFCFIISRACALIIYLYSLIGASIISIEFYMVIWGKAKEDALKNEGINVESSSTPKSPLLNYHMDEETEYR